MSEALLKNQQLASDVPRPNLLQNGGFEQWHQGPGPFSATNLITADKWNLGIAGTDTISITRDAVNVDAASQFAAAVTFVFGTGGGQTNIAQPFGSVYSPPFVSGPMLVQGKTITFSARVKTNVPNGVRVGMYQYGPAAGWTYGVYHPGDNTWQTISVTMFVALGATSITTSIMFSATGTYYVDNATLVIGSVPSDYVPAISYPDALPNERLASDVARSNLLTNGGLENWQRGSGPFTVSNAWTADRWNLTLFGTDTLSVQKTPAIVDTGSVAAASCTFVLGTGGGSTNLLARNGNAVDGQQIANRQCSFSVRVKTTTANAVRAAIYNGTVWTYSSYHSGSNNWETLTVTATMGALANSVGDCGVFFAVSCLAYVDNATFVLGSIAADYVPFPPADDFARCQRYCETPAFTQFSFVGATTDASHLYAPLPFKVRKATVPTITLSGIANWAAFTPGGGSSAATAVSVAGGTNFDGCAIQIVTSGGLAASGGASIALPGGTLPVIIESNP